MPAPFVFALDVGFWDSADGTTLATPQLDPYSSAAAAAATREGLDIVEGDLWFFSSDGSPLQAQFSQEPKVDTGKGTYFPGVYTLQPAAGENLNGTLSKIINGKAGAQVIVWIASTDKTAQKNGWKDLAAMKSAVDAALQNLTLDMAMRVLFKERSAA